MFFPTFLRWESWPGFWGCPYDQDGFQRVRYCYNATTRQMPWKPRCLMSLPGAKEQLWHVDGEHLYTSEPNLACYGSTQQVRQYLHNCCLHRHSLYTFIGQHHHHHQYIVIRISFSKTTRRYCPRTASTSSSPWSTLRSWSPTSRYIQLFSNPRQKLDVFRAAMAGQSFAWAVISTQSSWLKISCGRQVSLCETF